MERKGAFDAGAYGAPTSPACSDMVARLLTFMTFSNEGNFSDKQALASEVVAHIRSLDPPGRFLKRMPKGSTQGILLAGECWEELSDETGEAYKTFASPKHGPSLTLVDSYFVATHKICQVMRDISKYPKKNA